MKAIKGPTTKEPISPEVQAYLDRVGGRQSAESTFGASDYIMGAFPIMRVLGPAARAVGRALGVGSTSGKVINKAGRSAQDLEAFDKGKKQLMDWYRSNDYSARVKAAGQPEGLGERLASRGESADIVYLDKSAKSTGYTGAAFPGIPGFLKPKVKIAKSGSSAIDDLENLAVHELGHVSIGEEIFTPKDIGAVLNSMPIPKPKPSNVAKAMGERNVKYYSDPNEMRQRALETLMYMKRSGRTWDDIVKDPWVTTSKGVEATPHSTQRILDMYEGDAPGLAEFGDYLKKMLGLAALVEVNRERE
jgi:hypothetical protein